MSDSPRVPDARPVVDSPWFWLTLFSAAGVVFLVAMAPKYAERQRRLELQFRARQEMNRRQAEGEQAAREPGAEGEAPPPPRGELIISIWPLGVLFALVFVVSAGMLWHQRRGPLRQSRSADEEAHR